MRKLICIILSMTMLISFSGCGRLKEGIKEYIEDKQYVYDLTDEIIRCFNERDVEGLKELFCQNAKDGRKDLDTQIENMFAYYEGVCTSDYYANTHGGWAGSIEDGEYVNKHNVIDIQDIETSEGKEYVIGYSLYVVCDLDPGRIGIGGMSLEDDRGNELVGVDGFTWLD